MQSATTLGFGTPGGLHHSLSAVTPWHFKTKSRSTLQQTPVDCLDEYSRLMTCFYPRLIFVLPVGVIDKYSSMFTVKSKFSNFQSRYWQNYER